MLSSLSRGNNNKTDHGTYFVAHQEIAFWTRGVGFWRMTDTNRFDAETNKNPELLFIDLEKERFN